MLKYFAIPFATGGGKTAVPNADPGTGAVSYQTGWGTYYQLVKTDPNSLNVDRQQTNQMFFDVTSEIKLLQEHGLPDFITTALNGGTPHEYGIGDVCRYNGAVYVSRVAANVDLPSVAASWSLVRLGGVPKTAAGGTADVITADFSPDYGPMVDGNTLMVQHGAANTGAVTINPDGTGAIAVYKGANAPLLAGDIAGADYWGLYVYDATLNKLQMLNPATGVTAGYRDLASLGVTVAANAMTLSLAAETLDFRSTVLTSGAPVTRIAAAAGALVVPNGATLGTAAGIAARIVWGWIDNAGTPEPFVINLAGGNSLDETGLISTTALTAASDSANVFYSTTARANVAYRVRGFCDITEAAPGVWATAPVLVQPTGGQALTSLSSLGFSQSWQNITGSRTAGVTYTNTTGRPIALAVSTNNAATSGIVITVAGVTVQSSSGSVGGGAFTSDAFAIVPPGATYVVTTLAVAISTWNELR